MSSGSVLSRCLPPTFRPTGPLCAALLAAAVIHPFSAVRAQSPGDVDTTFTNPTAPASTYALLFSIAPVRDPNDPAASTDPATLPPVDGYFLLEGGDKAEFGRIGLPSGGAATESTANFGALSRIVYTLVPDQYGAFPNRYLVGGKFGPSATNGLSGRNILRFFSDLNSYSNLDGTFDPGTGANDFVTTILPITDGVSAKLIVGGQFTSFNGFARMHLVCLNDDGVVGGVTGDGSVNVSFNPNLSFDADVLALAQAPDLVTATNPPQILVGGTFNHVNSTNIAKLARLNYDGTLDTSFAPVIDERVNTIAVQTDGKILIGGDFGTVNGVHVANIARLNPDGSLDLTYAAAVGNPPSDNPDPVAVYTITLLADGRAYIGGNFLTVDGITRNYLALLNADGSVFTDFDPSTNVINPVQVIVPVAVPGASVPDVYVGESHNLANSNKRPSIVALVGVSPLPAVTTPITGTGTGGTGPSNEAISVNITPKGRVAGGKSQTTMKNGMFVLSRDGQDDSQELVVQLMVGGNFTAADATITGFPGAVAGDVITSTFAAGETTSTLRVLHHANARAGNRTLTLTVMNPQDGVTTYAAGTAPVATLHINNK